MDCGNCDKFIGIAYEKGEAIIEKDHSPDNCSRQYSWIFFISDKHWEYDYKVKKCFYCNSTNIKIV
jgi:hypothetical protein